MVATARVEDVNGWWEIKKNPLSKAGVFEYLGTSIRKFQNTNELPDPNRVYKVYRAPEELNNPDTLESFKLIPWIDGHVMLGDAELGLTPAERKGVQGVVGEEVFFEGDKLYGNIKVFSEALDNVINNGKKELSAGYRCKYILQSGTIDGQSYDVKQIDIRGNHLASVKEGRMGKDVAVMDSSDEFVFTLDAKEIIKMADQQTPVTNGKDAADPAASGGEMTIAELAAVIESIKPQLATLMEFMGAMKPADAAAVDADPAVTPAATVDPAAKEPMAAMDEKLNKLNTELDAFKKEGIKAVMGEIAARDRLANRLSQRIGTFDHADKTVQEVAAYGAEKLGIKCAKGSEVAAVEGFLTAPVAQKTFGMDSKGNDTPKTETAVDRHLAGKKGDK